MQNGHGNAILFNLPLIKLPYVKRFAREAHNEIIVSLSNESFVNAAAHLSHRNEQSGGADHSHMNGHVELKRSCRGKKSKFEHLNQSLLFDQLVNR